MLKKRKKYAVFKMEFGFVVGEGNTDNGTKKDTIAWQSYQNNKEATINWQFTTKDGRIKLKKLFPTIIY